MKPLAHCLIVALVCVRVRVSAAVHVGIQAFISDSVARVCERVRTRLAAMVNAEQSTRTGYHCHRYYNECAHIGVTAVEIIYKHDGTRGHPSAEATASVSNPSEVRSCEFECLTVEFVAVRNVITSHMHTYGNGFGYQDDTELF